MLDTYSGSQNRSEVQVEQVPSLLRELALGFRESPSGSLVSDDDDDDLPLRAELFSAAQMAAHGKTLASITNSASAVAATACCRGWRKTPPSSAPPATS
jgi:hypothetical protein